MMDNEIDVNISKVVGPTSSSSSTASNGFNKALTRVGAAVMGVGTLTESEPLVLCGLALVTVSLYRQRHGIDGHPGEHGLHHGQGLLPDQNARTTKMANPKKGIWMKRRIHPILKAEPARQLVFMKNWFWFFKLTELFSGFGGSS